MEEAETDHRGPWPLDLAAKVYSWVMRYTERQGYAPSVLEVAKGCGLGVLTVAETVGGLAFLYLSGDPDDPALCLVEVSGE